MSATGDEAIEIKPEAIELVVDQSAGKGSVHLSIPAAALGSDAAALGALGGGDTIDIDALFDGQALYVKSPLAADACCRSSRCRACSCRAATSPAGSSWARPRSCPGSPACWARCPRPPANPANELKDLDPAELKQKLEDAGVTVTVVGREQRNGVDSEHLLLNVDLKKLEASDLAGPAAGRPAARPRRRGRIGHAERGRLAGRLDRPPERDRDPRGRRDGQGRRSRSSSAIRATCRSTRRPRSSRCRSRRSWHR